MKDLDQILQRLKVEKVLGAGSTSVPAIQFDSRKVEPDHLFVAVRGTQADGHDYIQDAIQNGARIIVCEKLPESKQPGVAYVKVENTSELLGRMVCNFFDNPSSKLKLIGITGTNGKTTTATLLYRLFKNLGYKTGLISTIKNYIHNIASETTYTTPDPIQINSLLNEMLKQGCEYCFIEVSSHALSQNRTAGLQFAGGIFTNLSHDHLDYHRNFHEYLKTKQKFFDGLDTKAFALTNADDRNGKIVIQNTKAWTKTYAMKTLADFKCKVIESHFDGMFLNIDNTELWTRFVGEFNAYNILAVYAAAMLLDQEQVEILKTLSNLKSVPGRFEILKLKGGITAIIDYAHTPDALTNVLRTINQVRQKNQLLITVVGAGGDRDKTKRPLMAKVAVEKSDKLILTSDNPRTEDQDRIFADMLKGVERKYNSKVIMINNRREAIKTACLMAQKDDIILVAGKGHESYQEIDGVKHHFDDREVIREMLRNNGVME
ncbi:UDP-N-acetylmuramoyl-L-alanyl-D-glutamate--2,6-diaminopimelate ligase [subsurface metagenome]|nr:UDP-N-acetylmuramoyl-L-alanyl-D-glutamate--2,6-diaminopimelate ligase [Bacteroidota bacterium]